MSDPESVDGPVLPGFDDAVFISYTHVDNQPFGLDEKRWISHLHEQLTSRVQQLYGARVTVWRDDKLQGNDVFPETLVDRLSRVAVLVSVCSPRYLHSEWCQREIDAFVEAAEADRGVRVGTKSRLFKVLKTPVPADELHPILTPLLGYEFYEELPQEHRVREFLLNPDPEARWKFYARLDDLAQDIAALLRDLVTEAMHRSSAAPASGRTVYLADATSDVAPYRDNLRRDLERRGHRVLPERASPLTAEELTPAVREALARADLSVHLLGARYGTRPEGEERSIPHLQLDLASDLASEDHLKQWVWLPDGLEVVDSAQAALIGDLQAADCGLEMEIIRSPFETFKAHVIDLVTPAPVPRVAPDATDDALRVYLVHDQGDREPAAALQAVLESQGLVVMLPLSDGTEAEAREIHEMSMVLSDAVIICYGTAKEHWVRMKLFDLVKAPGWGRTEPFAAKAVWLGAPRTPHKATYATNEAVVLDGTNGAVADTLAPFFSRLLSGARS